MNQSPATVGISDGQLEGSFEDGVYIFKGIPYAAPPVGNNRWLAPQPVQPWTGVRPAKEFSNVGIQPEPLFPPPGPPREPETQSEDCLYLNVWTPGLDDRKRPVMVWIHGGAFTMGSGSAPNTEPTGLVRKGETVLVTINYRLGQLGFLRLRDISGGAVPSTGNEALLDQIAALEWVKRNIAAFGGDPENVTVFGESAGAMSIGCLMVMPKAKGLFSKAILESGTGSTAIPAEIANERAAALIKELGIDPHDAAALRRVTPQQLLDAEVPLRQPTAPGEAVRLTAVSPVIDGELIPGVTNELAAQGAAKDIVAMVGTNLDEYRLFALMEPPDYEVTEENLAVRLSEFVDIAVAPRLIAGYRAFLERRGEPAGLKDIATAVLTDIMFRIPATRLVEAQTAQGVPAYHYLFTWTNPNPNPLGACHALEIGFVFGTHEPVFCGTGPEADRLSLCIQDAWLNFARTGDPSGECMGVWPAYGAARNTMLLGRESHVEVAPYDDVRALFDGIEIKKSPLP